MSISLSSEYNQALARIEGWIYTYSLPPFDGSGGIGGPIATYWASSPYMVGPYIMNVYGLIRGLCRRAGDDHAGGARLRAERLALYYLKSQDPTTGFVVCCWGEEPFRGNGLVQQASVVAALWDLQRTWPHQEVANAARRCWQSCLNSPLMRADWTAHNMALRSCEALMLSIQARGDSRPDAIERALLQHIGQQVADAQWGKTSPVAGAIPQSRSDDDLIMPYQGKCLNPLVMLSQCLGESVYLDMAKRLADFILANIENDHGGWVLRGKYEGHGSRIATGRRLYQLRRLFPFLEPHLRRHRQRQIDHWRLNPWPQWLARGVDTAQGLYHLGQALGEERYTRAALTMTGEILRYQSPLGGLRNTLGFFGDNPRVFGGLVWQDAAAIPRWNSYAIQFLHELAAGTPVLQPIAPPPDVHDEVNLADNQRLIETTTDLLLTDAQDKAVWRIRKGYRWGRPFLPVNQWSEGGSATGRKTG
jgi:hypothetical protein